jgi:apolipoprotein D and lipocalin family protein
MTSQPPASPSRPDAAGLDARILQVEQRLIAREQAMRVHVETIGQRLRQKVRAGRQALPLIGLAAAASALVALVWWTLRRRSQPAGPAQHHAGHAVDTAGRHGELPWVRLAALAWPMLPAAWRSRISPATASTLAAVGLPLVERLLQGRRPAPLETMSSVDLARFAGTWFVVAQLPIRGGLENPVAETLSYLRRPDGGFDVLAASPGRRGAPSMRGVAQVAPGSGGARLSFSSWPAWLRWLPLAWTEHGVLHVDAAYDEALVGSSDRRRLWLLARRPPLAPQRRHALWQLARDRGFAVDGRQAGGDAPKPAV